MESTMVYMNSYAVLRLLQGLAQRIGLDEGLASAVAQVHMQQHPVHMRWTAFLVDNCAGCALVPTDCAIMAPKAVNCVGETSPEALRAAYAHSIETGRLRQCPIKETRNEENA